MTTLPDYLAAVAAGLQSLAPALRDVAVGRGRLGPGDLERRRVATPAARVGLLRLRDLERQDGPGDGASGGAVAATAQVSALLILEDGRAPMADQAHGLVSGLALAVPGHDFGAEGAAGAAAPEFRNLFSGEYDRRGIRPRSTLLRHLPQRPAAHRQPFPGHVRR